MCWNELSVSLFNDGLLDWRLSQNLLFHPHVWFVGVPLLLLVVSIQNPEVLVLSEDCLMGALFVSMEVISL